MAYLGGNGNAYRIFVGKLRGKILLGRPRRRSVDSNKMRSSRNRMGAWTEYLAFYTEKWSATVKSVVSESFRTRVEFIDHMRRFSRRTALC